MGASLQIASKGRRPARAEEPAGAWAVAAIAGLVLTVGRDPRGRRSSPRTEGDAPAVNRKVLRLLRTAKLCGRALRPPVVRKRQKYALKLFPLL